MQSDLILLCSKLRPEKFANLSCVKLEDGHRPGKRYNEGYYGANSSMTAVLGRLASYSGKVVKWDEAVASNLTSSPSKVLAWDAPAPVQKDAGGNYPIPMPGTFVPC